MPESDFLLTIAEVAVTFAGFASLVGVLGQRTSADDPRVIGVRMRAMLLSSLLVVAFSIVPILLDRYGAGPDLVWRGSTLILLAATASFYAWFVPSLQALGRAHIPMTRYQSRVVMPTLTLVLVSLTTILVLNLFLAAPAGYLTALALLLFQSGFAFCLIVFSFLPRVEAMGNGVGRDAGEK